MHLLIWVYAVLGTNSRTLFMLGKPLPMELDPQFCFIGLNAFFMFFYPCEFVFELKKNPGPTSAFASCDSHAPSLQQPLPLTIHTCHRFPWVNKSAFPIVSYAYFVTQLASVSDIGIPSLPPLLHFLKKLKHIFISYVLIISTPLTPPRSSPSPPRPTPLFWKQIKLTGRNYKKKTKEK